MKKIRNYYITNNIHHVVSGDAKEPAEPPMSHEDIAELVAECDHLRQQVADLQAAGTALREVKREEDITYAVAEFHTKFGYPVRTTPAILTGSDVRFRMRLMIEEFFEILDAVFPQSKNRLAYIIDMLNEVARSDLIEVDMEELADGLCDLDYIVEGTRQYFGIPRAAVLKEVHRANMEKSKAKDIVGKPMKPEGWNPPDIASVLRAHGWVER